MSDGPDDDQVPGVDPSALDTADPDAVAQQVGDDAVAGTVSLDDGTELAVALDDDIVEAARDQDVDVDRLKAATVPGDMTFAWSSRTEAATQTDGTATVPVKSERFSDFGRLSRNRDAAFIQDDQIRRLRQNSINYTQRVGRWLLRSDDLIPSVKERLKALIVGEGGLDVEPADPDSDADQRLANHLADVYDDHVRPTDRIDAILRENLMNARAVMRATDLAELDLKTLQYVKDGITGEEIYIQRKTSVHTFEITDGDDDAPDVDVGTERIDEQPLIIGEQVFDISLYDTPPLEAVADTAINKMVLQRLKARKAEITSFGAVYASVEAPSYLPEDQYFDRVQDDNFDGDQPPTKLERALKSNLQQAFDTLKDFQSGTVMSVPDYWTLEQLEIPETNESLDDQIRGYNKDIARRLLVPLDLIELREGAELSRDTLFRTLMTTIAGWRREILRVFDSFARAQADIQGIDGRVEHSFPPLHDHDEELVLQALQFAGMAGLSQKEVRQMLNSVQGVDLQTDEPQMADGLDDLPADGGPDDGDDRQEVMGQFLDEQRRGAVATDDQDRSDPSDGGVDLLEAAFDDDVDLFRVMRPTDEERPDTADSDVLGFGVDFPNSGVYIDWNIDAWGDDEKLDGPHVSDYSTIDDVRQVTHGDIELVEADDVTLAKADDGDLPVDCRKCDDQVRIAGSFYCPGCHPGVQADDFDGDLAAATTPEGQVINPDRPDRLEAAHTLRDFDSVREAAHHVRRTVEQRHQNRGTTVDVERRSDGRFAVLIRDADGGFRGSATLKESDTDPNSVIVVGTEGILTDLKLSHPRQR